MSTRLALLCALSLAGCAKPASAPDSAAPAPAATETPAKKTATRRPNACPDQAVQRGSKPPQGLRVWCELPDGREHGPMRSWHDEQQLKTEGGYFEGRPHGRWRSWDPSGQLRSEGEYDRGTMVGVWTTYYADARKATEIVYDGQAARYEAWHPNGVRHRKGQYLGGDQVGTWQEWDDQGRLVATHEGDAIQGENPIGVPECDRYLETYSRCIREKMPQSIQAEVEKALDESVKAWRREAKKPDGRKRLAEICTVAHSTMLRSLESLGCT